MQFNCASCQGVESTNENKKEFKVIKCSRVLDIVSDGCIPLCGGQVLFELAHTLWGINRFMCL
jgi:hypothetical protein